MLGAFCAEHENWKELLEAEPFNLRIAEDGCYTIFKYNQLSSDFNNPIVREARGIIFKTGEWEYPVCWPFNKFGNYGESYAPDIDWNTAFVTEKVDGSLIKVWHDNNNWYISTNGTIDAFKADLGDIKISTFGDYFLQALERYTPAHIFRTTFEEFTNYLKDDLTYMFELVGPYNRVVVPHEEIKLYFLGVRDKFTGKEYLPTSEVAKVAGVEMFNRPATYSLATLEDCLQAAKLKTWDDEGFVVCDANFNRVKIKSPAYVLAHFMRNNNVITRKHIIKIILTNEIAEFLCYADEYKEELEKVQKLMNSYHNIGNKLAQACRQMILLERKDYAKLVQALPKMFQGLLYKNYERFMSAQEYTKDWNENKWDDILTEVEKLNKEILEV